MRFAIVELIFPHYCCSCAQIGDILCESCYNDIIEDSVGTGICIGCQTLTVSDGVCVSCQTSFSKAWVVGRRESALSTLIDESKYYSRRIGCSRQSTLLEATVPQLPQDMVVVPVPTIRPHIRQRGYGHSELIAKRFAKQRGLRYERLIRRLGSHVQQGSSLKERVNQAKISYVASETARGKTILLVDDVYTTGSSVRYAAQALRDSGASDVWVAVTARQTLDG